MTMQNYQLIAFDMDGTLLNSQKTISPASLDAIARATKAGKTVILSTGRNPNELNEYISVLRDVRYLSCISGALVYDLKERRAIYRRPMPAEIIFQIFDVVRDEDVMLHLLTEDFSVIQRDSWEHIERYGLGVYKPMFKQRARMWEDIPAQYRAEPFEAAKLNIHFTSPEALERFESEMARRNVPVTMARAERSSIEINAEGVSKGVGLSKLCEHLGIPLSQTIAVGDAPNDIEVLRTAGLSVAMGNAAPEIKALTDETVADCDHDGCAEAIDRFLLG